MIFGKIQKDLKEALKAGDSPRVSTLRFLLAAVHNRKIALRQAQGEILSDEEVVGVIRQQAKQHRESIEAYRQGKRDDLVAKEQAELDILSTYLPRQMGDDVLEKVVKETVAALGATGPADFGKVMGAVMGKVKGKADGNQVAVMVKNQLSLL